MKISSWLLLLTALVPATAFAVATVDPCDKPCLIEKAMAGDGAAALSLANFALKESTNFKRNHERMVYWYRIAAENGNATGQWNYAMFLASDSNSRTDCVRALYWFKRAESQKHPLAKDVVLILHKELADKTKFAKGGCSRAL
jgi:TPR repeat protein